MGEETSPDGSYTSRGASTSLESGVDGSIETQGCPRKGDPWYSNPNGLVPVRKITIREQKWRKMIHSWDKFMKSKHDKVKERCRKGIPQSMRSWAWLYLTGAQRLKKANEGTFKELQSAEGNETILDEIQRDLHRTFPEYEMFSSPLGYGQEDLRRILKCYAVYNAETGYCQAMAPVAATLLQVLPAEDAFWVLVLICDEYLAGYYTKGLAQLQADADILHELLKKALPAVYEHLERQKIHPLMYMTEWFMCVFSRTLEWSCLLRILDMFFCEGVKVLFRVAIAILTRVLGTPEQRQEYPEMMDITQMLRRLPQEAISAEALLPEFFRVKLTKKDLERIHVARIKQQAAGSPKARK